MPGIATSGVTGGRNLGVATGRINIDTTQARQASGQMKNVGRDIASTMDIAKKATEEYNKSLEKYTQAVRSAINSGGIGQVMKSKEVKEAKAELTAATAVMNRFKQKTEETTAAAAAGFEKVAASVKKTEQAAAATVSRIERLSTSVKQFRNEIAAVGVAGAALSAIGLKTAAGIQEATIQLKGMVGSEQAAVKLMTELRKQASAAGVPFADILAASRQLLPTLNGSTQELEKWLPLVRRVAVLNQREGLQGAGFAINEALSSGGTDLVSLTERFNISRTQLRKALAQTGGDFAAALDIVLTRMGITIETADEMGTTFNASLNAAKDAAAQLLAAGFQPLLETLTPIIRRTADWLNELRQSNPEIAKVGAGIAAISAVGAPTLLFLGQMVQTITSIKKAIDSINAAKLATLGNLAKGGLAVAGGIGLGIGVSRGIGRATGNDALANADLNTLWTQIKQILFTILAGLSEVFKQVGNLFLNSAEGFNRALVNMINGMAGFVRFIASVLPDELGGDRLTGIADNLDNFAQRLLETSQQRIDDARTRLDQGQENFLKGALDFLGLGGSGAAGGAGGVGSPGGGAADTAAQERETALKEYHEGLKQIEINRLKQIADATEQYADQRADAIEQYERQAAREQEDFLRQRARQEEQFTRDVERINRERYEREAEWAADLAERINELRTSSDDRIAEIREEGNERIADIEEDYRQDRERREREHRLSLLSAAARLDASAIAEEQRRYKEQNQTAEEQLEERLQDEQEQLAERLENERQNLEERIQQEQEAHQERIEEARKADAKRIADMREALNEQQRLEDEDRAIRLARSKEDHQLQLQALQEAHNQRMQQIAEQAAEERRLLKEQFEEKMDLLNEQHQQETTYQQIGEAARGGGSSGGSGSIGGAFGFANGGPVYGTGMAMLHGSRTRPEYVLDGATTAALRSVLGNFNQASLLGAVAGGGGRSNTFNMQSGAIQIHAAPGQSAGDIGAEVEAALYRFFESVGAG